MIRARDEGVDWLRNAHAALKGQGDYATLGMPDLLNHLVDRGHPAQVLYITGHWMDINNLEDLQRAGAFAPMQDQ